MSKTKQLFALFQFSQTMNFYVWIIAFMTAIPYLIFVFDRSSYSPSLSLLTSNQTYYFIMFYGAGLVLPELSIFGFKNQATGGGADFLLTRAVDRHLVFRARSALFYFVVVIIPGLAFLCALSFPELRVSEYDKLVRDAILTHIDGAQYHREGYSDILTIPHGHALVAAWSLFCGIFLVLMTQTVLVLLARVPFRTFIFFALTFSIVFSPLFVFSRSSIHSINFTENAFLHFAQHPVLWTSLLAVAVVASQLWCERRFRKMEL